MTQQEAEIVLKLAEIVVDVQKQSMRLRKWAEKEVKIQRRYRRALETSILLRDRKCMNPDCLGENSSIHSVQIEENDNANVWNYITLCEDCCVEFEHSKADINKYYSVLEKEYEYDYNNENFFLLSEDNRKVSSLL